MGDKTGIEWTDMTWNPVRGCSRVSEGCRHCYAEQQAARIIRMGKGKPTPYDGLVKTVGGEARWTGVVRMVEDRLADPLKWRKPRRIFANSMSDLFHEELDDEQIDRVFAVMLLAPRHTFQVLTKRAARMRAYFADPDLYERVLHAADEFRRRWPRLNGIGIADPATSPARCSRRTDPRAPRHAGRGAVPVVRAAARPGPARQRIEQLADVHRPEQDRR